LVLTLVVIPLLYFVWLRHTGVPTRGAR